MRARGARGARHSLYPEAASTCVQHVEHEHTTEGTHGTRQTEVNICRLVGLPGVRSDSKSSGEDCGCLSCGDLDGFPPLLHPKSLNLTLKLFLCVPILLYWTPCRLRLHPPCGGMCHAILLPHAGLVLNPQLAQIAQQTPASVGNGKRQYSLAK